MDLKSLSQKWMYYAGILAAFGTNVDINDLKHIQDLLDAEEQGRLIELPCKVGDVIYQALVDVTEYTVTAFGLYKDRIIVCADCMENGIGFSFNANQIGKRYFLTKAESEKALEKMEE